MYNLPISPFTLAVKGEFMNAAQNPQLRGTDRSAQGKCLKIMDFPNKLQGMYRGSE